MEPNESARNGTFIYPIPYLYLELIERVPGSDSVWSILEVLRSVFLISRGRTSVWSVEMTSHPSKAMPEEHVIRSFLLKSENSARNIPNPATPQPAPSSITRFPFSLDGENLPFLQFFSCIINQSLVIHSFTPLLYQFRFQIHVIHNRTAIASRIFTGRNRRVFNEETTRRQR